MNNLMLMHQNQPNQNKRGDAGIPIIFFVALIALFMVFCVSDFLNCMNKATIIKTSMNRAVKAAAMQVDLTATNASGETLFGNGIFVIDEDEANKKFREILSGNLGLDPTTLEPKARSVLAETPEILEFKVLNDYQNMPNTYYSSTIKNSFDVENPSVYAVIKFKVRGLAWSPEIQLGKLSSAQLLNLQNL